MESNNIISVSTGNSNSITIMKTPSSATTTLSIPVVPTFNNQYKKGESQLKQSQSLDLDVFLKKIDHDDPHFSHPTREEVKCSFPVRPTSRSLGSVEQNQQRISLAPQRLRAFTSPPRLSVSINGNSSVNSNSSSIRSKNGTLSNRDGSLVSSKVRSITSPIAPEFFYPENNVIGSPQVLMKSVEQQLKDKLNHLSPEFNRINLVQSSENNDQGISIPYNFQHLKHVDKNSKGIIIDKYIQEKVEVKRSSYMDVVINGTRQFYYVELEKGKMMFYKSNKKEKILTTLIVYEMELDIQREKKKYILSSSKDRFEFINVPDVDEWTSMLMSSGAINFELLEIEREVEQLAQKNEIRKMEEEFIKEERINRSNGKRSSIMIGNSVDDQELLQMDWVIKPVLEVDVEIETQCQLVKIDISITNGNDYNVEWTIKRKYKDLLRIYKKLTHQKIKSINSSNQVHSINVQCNQVLTQLLSNRQEIFSHRRKRKNFIKFLSPIEWYDIKSDQFVLPFNL